MRVLSYNQTPVVELKLPSLEKFGVRLLIKREDLNHPTVSGNKWWKLKWNLEDARQKGFKRILTFGGAFSNHIFATAAAASELEFESIGIIRGEEVLPLNSTLDFAKRSGMTLHYVSREEYRNKVSETLITSLRRRFGEFYLIPEGGTNLLSVKGCAEFTREHLAQIKCQYICLPVGTGGTLAGIVSGFGGERHIVGLSVLKDGGFLVDDVNDLVRQYTGRTFDNWRILTTYHHGGYAKASPGLLAFIEEMKSSFSLPLEHVYSAKLLWGIVEEIRNGSFERGSTVLAVHTGGLRHFHNKN